jgi:catechol 2,3-dioxygenase-like lactoylglutathione lyase family enzyme
MMRPVHCSGCRKHPSLRFSVNGLQEIALAPEPTPAPAELIEEITFATDDIPALRSYLEFHQIAVTASGILDAAKPGGTPLTVIDPEGHRISFIQWAKHPSEMVSDFASRTQIIHAGFVVHDREAEDHFYKDVLGFHLYWHGGMKDDGVDDWAAMQVPDGTDWLEYMLNISPSADHRTLGVMNHVSLGVRDIHATYDELVARGWKATEQPKMGRDGKWQLNLYDPDETRVEFMEFTPTQKPCCSPFAGPQPGPNSGASSKRPAQPNT